MVQFPNNSLNGLASGLRENISVVCEKIEEDINTLNCKTCEIMTNFKFILENLGNHQEENGRERTSLVQTSHQINRLAQITIDIRI